MVIPSGTRGGHEARAGVEGWLGAGEVASATLTRGSSCGHCLCRPGLAPAPLLSGQPRNPTAVSLMLGTALDFGGVGGCGAAVAAGARWTLLHPCYNRLAFFFLPFFFFCVHIMCVCAKVVFSKTSLFIDDVIVIVLFFWLINCLLSLLCIPAKISHTSSWKGYEETSN